MLPPNYLWTIIIVNVFERLYDYKDKVILANCLNGYWIRLTKEIYYYFLEAVEKDIEPNMFFNMFEDQEDREYIEQIYRKMVSIAILEDKKILLPKEISIEITNKCNLNCKHCCIDANSRTDEMSTDEIYRSIRKIAKWNPDNVSISGGEPLVRRDIKEILIYLRKVYNGKITLSSLFSSIIRVFIYTYGGMKIIKSQMTMGELIAFIEYTTLFINPCIRILKSNASIQKLKVSINRIYDFLEMKNSIAQNNYGIKIRNRINEIVFDNVSFSYDKKMVIENLSFKLERGKTYAFVGETGCGKSTIVNLLFRLWDTKSGNIMIDGENIKEYNLFSLRKQLSIATQNVYIKDDSIENNILMGRKKEDCAYDEICKLVGMESILSKFPKEKDVSVGENGNKLSGGQKQRIAMARALVHADNVLILDEATSALDNITQNEIMKNIKPLYQDKIVIIITHRLDTISDVDKIFVMSEGRICEEGQHNELMKKGEKYYALVQNL